MKNKKGFTLIELLAVIVILAVIMVIAVPKILEVIENSRNSAADSSLKLVKNAIKTQVTTSSMSSVNFIKEDGCYLFDFTNNNSNAQNLSLKNKDKISGSIKYCDGKLQDDTLVWDGQTSNKEPELQGVKCTGKCTIDADGNGIVSIGDTISIGGENFYVIKNDGSTISIFAYYNLNAGGMYDSNSSTWTAYENLTYKQDETMKGYDANSSNTNIRYGIVKFSDVTTPDWEYANNDTIPTSYYNDKLSEALEQYSNIITTSMGKTMIARLITKSEIEGVVNEGESLSNSNIKDKSDSKGVPWMYSSTYWTGSAVSSLSDRVWSVGTNGVFGRSYHTDNGSYGVRPVFDILVSDI